MDAMEDMEVFTGSNPGLAPVCQVLGRGTLPGLKYRHLGKSGLKVSSIALGSLKSFSNDDSELNEEIVTLAFENGINFFDISEPFTSQKAEIELGRIIKKKGWSRRQFTVATKIYWDKTEDRALSRKEILESVKDSLENLQLDYIDLVIIHKNDSHCPLEEVVKAINFLITTGKILYWGTAKWSPVEIFESFSIARAMNCVTPLCEYAEYHPFHREKVELYMAELYNKVGLGLITWSPVSLGLVLGTSEEQTQLVTKLAFKSGKYKVGQDANGIHEGIHVASHTVKQLEMISERFGCTLSQLLVCWSLRNNTSQVVVVSASSLEQLTSQLSSLQLLSKMNSCLLEEMDRILGNKPTRQPMVSTLQQRWTATGGVPPQ
ncbi:voltage-gated potassium channel subunit beta-2 [Eurytemora carolleeae]|uniref:voltage-gated potassium channel subunit beta-2 n=1 Tax=Eurytemora carolleeae TaxID=1294199 RepID=UPI000C78F38F|nr:voltage-gated potassium channel subunit beta-2 [Eurytemora carolleeae]|eukprot:XP_023321935.1 voltage-gated potassium channel subunit beta-2-like [Eurytemora affinis]